MYEKNNIAIITPSEYEKLRNIVKFRFKILLDILLYTGMRYTEIQELEHHAQWFDSQRKIIYLPHLADKKVNRGTPSRYVYLSNQGKFILDRFFEDTNAPTFPFYQGFDMNLKRWVEKAGIKHEPQTNLSISLKTFRKTWECWLVISYPDRIPLIAMSQGHTEIVAMRHYLNVPFSRTEKLEIEDYTRGWVG